ncbi:4'-phosphopantetheinyl transferase superfamily protein [Apilactobacillus apisilvae]|uniref:4'-phosphopantetheinyl transferase superfamily protein n=1 Tax=Apilactobacillus apisilvae TaxID=2923364 RepID=A0ABY4PFU2_9LACO|nr:4'-phosphopantetheinyl transferase superfamily protein [Apilactobacillus apisilvae]UQS84482.1 4'-phosphopantetheinyl transferase superfamily protein [Apilactobacillus apisilvae]
MPNNIQIFTDTINNPKYQDIFKKVNVNFDKYNQRQSIVGNCLLADYMNISVEELLDSNLFNYGKHGKPYLKSQEFYFNISNSYDLVILVISDQDVGVDIEKIRPSSYKRISRAFNDQELSYLGSLPEKIEGNETLKLWTIKEATLKLLGTGLSGKAKSVNIDIVSKNSASRLGVNFKLIDIDLGSEYLGTLATFAS